MCNLLLARELRSNLFRLLQLTPFSILDLANNNVSFLLRQ